MKRSVSQLLSLYLGLFLTESMVSLLDDVLIVLFEVHVLAPARAGLALVSIGLAFILYLLVGITPSIPRRYFLPVLLFHPVAMLAAVPISIYYFTHIQQISLGISALQTGLALATVIWAQQGFSLRWPLVPEQRLREHEFRGIRLAAFLVLNMAVVLPGTALYLGFCASLAVEHLSGNFLALDRNGLRVRVRTYVGEDGKNIHLVPMMHIGERRFYNEVSRSFPTNSIVLLEGVTDNKNLLRHKLRYERMAESLGLAQQQHEFVPRNGHLRHADVDIEQFSPSTIEFLNVVSLIHSQGLTLDTFRLLSQQSQSPVMAERLWADLLTLRNAHLFKQIEAAQREADHVVVPWGAAHMAGVSRELEDSGFQISSTQEYQVFRFETIVRRLRSASSEVFSDEQKPEP